MKFYILYLLLFIAFYYDSIRLSLESYILESNF